jgi:hypothetical protein
MMLLFVLLFVANRLKEVWSWWLMLKLEEVVDFLNNGLCCYGHGCAGEGGE